MGITLLRISSAIPDRVEDEWERPMHPVTLPPLLP